jgi:hypothetical protein
MSLLAPIVDPAACISTADEVVQVLVIPIMPLAAFLRWSDTAGWVPMQTLPVVKFMTLCFAIMVKDQVNNGCCIQHRLEVLYVRVDFFIDFRQVGCELINEHSWGQSIVSQHEVDLLSLVPDPADFLSDWLWSVSKERHP